MQCSGEVTSSHSQSLAADFTLRSASTGIMCRAEITTPALQEEREALDGASLAVPAALNGRMAAVGSPQKA